MSAKKLVEQKPKRRAASKGQYRETKERASRFNLDKEELYVYNEFVRILASFDEASKADILDSVLKDSSDSLNPNSEPRLN